MNKLKIGLVGCGGMMNSHVTSILTFKDVDIVAVADPRAERTKAMMKRTGAKRAYPSHKEFFEKEDKLDAVYIAVEPTAHVGIEETAIEKGLPFPVGKLMTLDLAKAKKIAKGVKDKKLITAVGFQDRYLDLADRIVEELADMKVGMVYGSWLGGVPQVWWWMRKDTCGAQLVEQNIHLVDMLRFFFGEAESVFATCGRTIICPDEFPDDLPKYDTDDFSTALITFKNGVTANLMSGCFVQQAGNPIRNGLTIVGREKSLEYELRANLCIYTAKSKLRIDRAIDQGTRHDRAFLDAVRAKDPSGIRSPYPDALKTLELALAANKSMDTGKLVKL